MWKQAGKFACCVLEGIKLETMGVGSWGEGGMDFHAWYRCR